jgi:hypothetical protein
VFPSPLTGGYHAGMIQKLHLKPAGERIGIKGLGWFAFRLLSWFTRRIWSKCRNAEGPNASRQYQHDHEHIETSKRTKNDAVKQAHEHKFRHTAWLALVKPRDCGLRRKSLHIVDLDERLQDNPVRAYQKSSGQWKFRRVVPL